MKPLTDMPESWKADLPPRPKRQQLLLRWIREGDEATVKHWFENTDHDISAHRPEDLQVINRSLDASFRRLAKSTAGRYEANVVGLGFYLGEVIVRNLGECWHLPNALQARAVLWLGNSLRVERYIYVLLAEERVYVLRGVRDAIERTAVESSLYQFYQRYVRQPRAVQGQP